MLLRILVLIALVAALSANLQAGMIIYELNIEYSGGDEPVGPAPWLRATFDDGGSAGQVSLMVSALGLTDPEFIRGLYFNLDPALSATALSFSDPVKVGQFDDPDIGLGTDAFRAGPSGGFDIHLAFATSNAKKGKKRFGAGEEATFTISGPASLVAGSFSFFCEASGGAGALPVAAKVQAIGGSGSGWLTQETSPIPEPLTIGLLASGAAAMLLRRRF